MPDRRQADEIDQLKAVGKARAESLLREAGIAEQPHSTAVTFNLQQNQMEVAIAIVAEPFVPVEVWAKTRSQPRPAGQPLRTVSALRAHRSECAVQSNSAIRMVDG